MISLKDLPRRLPLVTWCWEGNDTCAHGSSCCPSPPMMDPAPPFPPRLTSSRLVALRVKDRRLNMCLRVLRAAPEIDGDTFAIRPLKQTNIAEVGHAVDRLEIVSNDVTNAPVLPLVFTVSQCDALIPVTAIAVGAAQTPVCQNQQGWRIAVVPRARHCFGVVDFGQK